MTRKKKAKAKQPPRIDRKVGISADCLPYPQQNKLFCLPNQTGTRIDKREKKGQARKG